MMLTGGLILLLGGMRLLASSLRRMLGDGARGGLMALDDRPWAALTAGAAATAAVQSSSVTTLLVAGLADARLVSPRAALAAVFGANVGTTLTAQLTALAVDAWAPWLAAAGLGLMAVARCSRRGAGPAGKAGGALLACGLMFTGLTWIESAAAPLAYDPDWQRRLAALEGRPAAGIVAGFLLTTLLDSSSAAVAVLQRAVAAGLLSLPSAIPVLMGDNIGTTTATVLASAALGPRGRQAAFGHLLFNLAATAFWWPLRGGLAAAVMRTADSPAAALAHAHLAFNLSAALVQAPLIPLHLALARRLFPEAPNRG